MSWPPVLPPERQGRAAPQDVAEGRNALRKALAAGGWKTAQAPREGLLGGVRCLRFRPPGAPAGLVLHLHGGGYRTGIPDMIGPFAEALATRCGVEVVLPQYRLAPEHPFPAGLADALACLEELAKERADGWPLIVSGDSAGGGLAASLGVLAAAGAAPRIEGVMLLSPWLDLTVTALSYDAHAASDPLFSRAAAELAAELYLQGFDTRHPLASALHAPVTAYPPAFISAGSGEVLFDDAQRFHEKLQAIGASSVFSAIAGMEHVAVVRSLALTGSAETMIGIARFISSVVKLPPA